MIQIIEFPSILPLSLSKKYFILSSQNLNILEEKFPFDTFTFGQGDCIIDAGATPAGISILIEGGLKCVINCKKKRVIQLLFPGDILGLSEILNNEDFAFSVKAMTNGKIHLIDKEIFLGKLNNNPLEIFPLMKTLCNRINNAEQKLINKSENTDKKLVDILMNLSNLSDGSRNIDISIDERELSNLIDVSKRKIHQSLLKLSKEGVLRISSDSITISDKSKLMSFN